MPRITLREANQLCYRIDTSDLLTIERWFAEWLPRIWPANVGDWAAPCIEIQPMPHVSDWPSDNRIEIRWPFACRTAADAMPRLAEIRRLAESACPECGYPPVLHSPRCPLIRNKDA